MTMSSVSGTVHAPRPVHATRSVRVTSHGIQVKSSMVDVRRWFMFVDAVWLSRVHVMSCELRPDGFQSVESERSDCMVGAGD